MNAPAPSQPILEIQDLDIVFDLRKGQQIRAVDRVGFSVREGETFGIIGESGSGKSTIGRCIVCMVPPTHGTIRHFGEDLFALSKGELRKRRRAYQIVFQDPNAALDPRMTILQSVREPLDVAGIGTAKERQQKALAMIERVALAPELAHRYPHEISGGQKQRANIARALMLKPKLIVCDESVAALDVSIQADMLNLFADLQREFNLTYVFISHDLRVVAHVSDRVSVMYFGKMVELGTAAEIMEKPLHPYTQALLSAEPEPVPIDHRNRKRIILKGEIPSAVNPPSGCRFHTRCPRAQEECVKREPEWRELTPGRFVACHFAGPASSPAHLENHNGARISAGHSHSLAGSAPAKAATHGEPTGGRQ